jgi:hypothetical protein
MSFQFLALFDPNACDFTWATMLVIKASKCVNLASMVLGSLGDNLVANPLLVALLPFFRKPWPLLTLEVNVWPYHNSGWNVKQ